MKKLLILTALFFAALALGTEDHIAVTNYSDGNQRFFPDTTIGMLLKDGATMDSAFLVTGDNYTAGNGSIICTLTTSDTGIHYSYFIIIHEGDTLATDPVKWINYYAANVSSVSGDTTAADQLEGMFDQTERATLFLTGLDVRSTSDSNAIYAIGNGTGEAFHLSGGSGGHGAYITGNGSNTHGIFLAAGSNGTGFYSTGDGTGDGAAFIAGASGVDIDADIEGDITGSITIADSIGAGAVDAIWNEDTTGHGTAQSFAVLLKDTTAYQGAASGLTAGAVADAVWDEDTTGHGTAQSYSVLIKDTSAYQGSAAGLAQDDILGAMVDSNFARVGDTVKWNLKQLIVSGENNDSASIFAYNTGTTPVIQIEGDNLYGSPAVFIHSDSSAGVKIQTENKVPTGTAGGSTFPAVQIESKGPKGIGLLVANSNESDSAGLGSAMIIRSDGWNHGLTMSVGESSDTVGYGGVVPDNQAWQIEGPVHWYGRDEWRRTGVNSDDAFTLHGKQKGRGFYVFTDSNVAIRISNASGDSNSILLGGNVGFGASQGIDGYIDTVLKAVSATVDLSGSGGYAVTAYAVDTSGTDDTVSGIAITAKDMTGTEKGHVTTLTDGSATFNLDSGSYVFSSRTTGGYIWAFDTSTVIATDTTLDSTLWGYNIAIGAPTGDSLCRVYGYAYAPGDVPIEGAVITWSLREKNVYDVCNGTAIVQSEGSTVSASTGLWTLDLNYSQCFQRNSTASTSDSTLYKITVEYPGGVTNTNKSFDVPSADSVAFTW